MDFRVGDQTLSAQQKEIAHGGGAAEIIEKAGDLIVPLADEVMEFQESLVGGFLGIGQGSGDSPKALLGETFQGALVNLAEDFPIRFWNVV